MRLNLGCGRDKRPDYINVDVRSEVNPDLILDLEKERLPYPDDSVEEILCKDVLEHISHRRVREVLRDWHRVLKPNGYIFIRVPDMERLARDFVLGGRDWDDFSFFIFGAQDYPENLHKCGFTIPTLRKLLEEMGFVVEEIGRDDTNIICRARKLA